MDDFDGTNLANQCSEVGHGLIISKLSHIKLEGRHIKEADTDFLAVALDGQHEARLIAMIVGILIGALGDNITNLTFDTFLFLALLLHLSLLHLLGCLSLLDHGHLETMVHKDYQVFVESFFREPNMQLFGTSHPVEVKDLLTDDSIVKENFVKFAEFEEKYLVKVVLLNLPKLYLCGCEGSPFLFWDEERGWVIIWMIEFVALKISDLIFFDKIWPCIKDVIHRSEASTDHLILGIYIGCVFYHCVSDLTWSLP